MEEQLMPNTQAAASMADGGGVRQPPLVARMASVAPINPLIKQDTGLKGLSGWASDQGVSDALIVWLGQANRLMGRLQREVNSLHGTRNLFQNQDAAVGAQVSAVRLPSGFDGM
ncbi:hypothetical protein AB5J56_13190 [Streptomyces sp. R21]|uniref:WXG100 family type VII secretion target n=1 Tax=Streptomyces sp. R21 TaxID=3238627 RepID=A0AB39P928_9ACTN